jgi:hypothetical protein
MAQTNVQAFSGDVEISSNLAVNTNDLFVDTVEGRVGIGVTLPAYDFDIQNSSDAADKTVARLYSPENASGVSNTGLRLEKGVGYGGILKGFLSQGVGSGLSFNTLHAGTDLQAMTIMNSGNVGIGTTEPESPLEVHGPDLTGQAEGTTSLISRHIAGEDGTLNTFGIVNGNGEEAIGLQTQIDGRLFATDIAGGWASGAESRYRLCLQPYKGRVGIGKTVPLDNLHVSGRISTQNGNGLTPGVLFRSGENNTNSWEMMANISDSYAGDFTIDRLDASTRSKFVIRNNGRVGIGTTNPSVKLQVGGNAETSPQYLWIRGNRVNEAGEISGIHFYNSLNSGDRGNSRIINSRGTNNYGSNLEFWTNPDENVPALARMRILANGNVGINCSPSTLLEVKKSTSGPAVRLGSTDGMLEIGTIASTYGHETVTMQSYIDQGNSGTFSYYDRNLLALQPYAGRVGIGRTNPGHTLDVSGSVGIRGYTYSHLFYSYYHQTGIISSGQNYDVLGSQFASAAGGGGVDDGWYHAVAMRFDSNPFEKSTYTVWFYAAFGDYGNVLNAGLALQVSAGKLRLVTDGDAVSYPCSYLIHLHKYGGRDYP